VVGLISILPHLFAADGKTGMKKILIIAALLCCAGCQTHRDPTKFFLYAGADNEEFVDAFAAEPACHGLNLVTDLSKADLRVHYFGTSQINSNFPHPVSGYIAYPHASPDFSGDTPALAVKQACGMMQGKGGHVE
jgi:hypothetical protein